MVRSYRQICKSRSRATASKVTPREENTVLQAVAQRDATLRYLVLAEASVVVKDEKKDEKTSLTIAFGGVKEKIGRVAVTKLNLFLDLFDSVEISPIGERPLTAEVSLPKPYEGTGSYLQEGKAPPAWSGNLGVRLPGSGLVPLTGPEFEADLCRASDEAGFEHCLESILSEGLLAQGSGSHSHPLAEARLSSLR